MTISDLRYLSFAMQHSMKFSNTEIDYKPLSMHRTFATYAIVVKLERATVAIIRLWKDRHDAEIEKGKMKYDIKQIIVVNPLDDPRVQIDNEGKELIPTEQRCGRCDGTGNELMFMYRRCQACNGDGFSQGNEAVVKLREEN